MGYLNNPDAPDMFGDVAEFHVKFGLDYYPSVKVNLPEADVLAFRIKFMQEELDEFVQAIDTGSIPNMADALADLVYVALGTAHLMGLPFDAIWREVQYKNMLKERAISAADPRSKRGHSLDVVKPAGWLAPNHRKALRAAGWEGTD